MDCILSKEVFAEDWRSPHRSRLGLLGGFISWDLHARYIMNLMSVVTGFMVPTSTFDIKSTEKASKLLVDLVGGKNPKGLIDSLYKKYGVIIGQRPERGLIVDVIAAELQQLGIYSIIVEGDPPEPGQDRCLVFVTNKDDLLQKIRERCDELGLKYTAYLQAEDADPNAVEPSDSETKADAGASSECDNAEHADRGKPA